MSSNSSKLSQPPDELIKSCQKGNNKAFQRLVELTQHYLFNVAFKILLNTDDAKDAVQETYIKIWKHIGTYNTKNLFTTWIYKIVVNTCLDKLKSKTHSIQNNEEVTEHALEDDRIDNRDLVQTIKKLSQHLPYKQRVIFILKDLQDLSIEEVSDILKMKKGVVKSNLFYARKNIREKLSKLENRRIKNAV